MEWRYTDIVRYCAAAPIFGAAKLQCGDVIRSHYVGVFGALSLSFFLSLFLWLFLSLSISLSISLSLSLYEKCVCVKREIVWG